MILNVLCACRSTSSTANSGGRGRPGVIAAAGGALICRGVQHHKAQMRLAPLNGRLRGGVSDDTCTCTCTYTLWLRAGENSRRPGFDLSPAAVRFPILFLLGLPAQLAVFVLPRASLTRSLGAVLTISSSGAL